MKKPSINKSLDVVGMCTSIICMIHCIAIPVLFILGIDSLLALIDQEWIELTIIGISLVIGLSSFIWGYIQHKRLIIPILFLVGFVFILKGESIPPEWFGFSISIVGAFIIAYAHLQNLKWKKYATSH